MRKPLSILLILLIVAAGAALWKSRAAGARIAGAVERDDSALASPSIPVSEPSRSRAPSSVNPVNKNTDTSSEAGSGSGAALASEPSLGLSGVLAKYSGGKSWTIERDPRGNPMRMSGQGLKVMGEGAETSAFINELTQELGFAASPPLARENSRSANFRIVDYLQSYVLPTGETLPVYDAWLRLKGSETDGAYVVINLLKPVDTTIKPELQLSSADALEILKREMELKQDATLTVRPAAVIFADQLPHQKALQIEVGGPQPHWLVLVGAETRSVIYKKITSHN
jgi:hypothetical protein